MSLLVSGAALCVATAACGGSGKASPTPVAAVAAPAPTTTTEPGAAYAACLRDHGVDVPDRPPRSQTTVAGAPPSSRPPGTRPPGTRPSTTLKPGADPNAMQAARQACQGLQPADRPNGGPGTQNPAFQVYASCLKDHGVVLADNGGPGGPGGANRDDPAFKAADAICAPLRPTPPTTGP